MKAETRRIKVTLIDEMLGTNPGRRDIHEQFINSKAPDAETREEELTHLPAEDMVQNEMTVFYRDKEGKPAMACYHMYGFFKSTCGYLRKITGTESSKLKAYKKAIDGLIKVFADQADVANRYITLVLPEGGSIGNCQRPLRAQTMQGERVALANSETVPAGTTFACDICCFDPKLWDAVEEWLDYGKFNGLGQWRSSGKGAFTWEYVK